MATWKKIIVSGSSAHLLNVTASNLTEDRIVIAGPNGALESTNLIYDGSLFRFGNATVSGSIFSGSQFSGSFFGDGSGLTGVGASTLNFAGSEGTGEVDLNTETLLITGSANGIVTSGSGNAIHLRLDDHVIIDQLTATAASLTGSFTGSFAGDGSRLTGIAATLGLTGSVGSGSVDLKTQALTVLGTANEVTTAVSASTITVGLADNVQISGSLVVSGSVTGSQAFFNYIRVSGSVINDLTASYAMNAETTAVNSGAVYQVTPATASWIITHSLNTRYPLVEIWDSATNRVIEPDEIESINSQVVKVTFTTPVAGHANISRAGHVVSGSVLWENLIAGPSGSQVIVSTLGITGSLSVTGSRVDFTRVGAISGSVFSGSFVGDGSQLTGIAGALAFSGSIGNGEIDLNTQALTITGSANGIVTSGSGTNLFINLANHVVVNQLSATTASLTGSFSGSFFGDGSQLTGIAGTLGFSGSQGSGLVDLQTQALNITGSANGITTSGSGVDLFITLADHVIVNRITSPTASLSGSFTGSFFGDGSGLTGVASILAVSASTSGSGTIDLKTNALTISGSANEVDVRFNDSTNTLTIGLPNDVTISNNLTVEGDLIVNGDTTVINTTNTLVEDKFILLASGSTTATDAGIIVQSTAAGQGFALGLDASAERWALQKDLANNATSLGTPNSYVTATQFGTGANQPQYPAYGATGSAFGNIWVSTDTGDIYIWA